MSRQPQPPLASMQNVPPWAWAVAAAWLVGAVAALVVGRGGTAVLLGAVLAFLALATLLLSVPDGDPANEGKAAADE
ncbi:MAG TPA: hypothetical protein VHS99_06160 [Chloroflexota bacterium]|jgi:hypothetical protein|nr:hypothetical protein [Chloroflexota bacterium]